MDDANRQAPEALGEGSRRQGAAAVSEGLHRLAQTVGSGAKLFVDGSEPQDEQGLRGVPETGEAFMYVAMTRLMVRRLARS